jgi:predicted RNA-binding protein with PUA-like domain
MEISAPTTLYTIADVSAKTKISRSAIYREIRNRKRLNGQTEINQEGRLTVIYVGRSVRIREQDLIAFIDALALA